MKKTIKLAVVAALALGATSAFATNGSNLIATGAKARGMGGVGIATNHGAESALANAALITNTEGTEISFGGTIFMPDVKNTDIVPVPLGGAGVSSTASSKADLSVIPEVSIATKINENFYLGVGMWGTAGMGVDYRDTAAADSQLQMVTNLQLMQFGVPMAYKTGDLSLAFTPILQYGSLDINYNHNMAAASMGVAQDLQFGYNLGIAYEIDNITLGAIYKSKIDMQYKGFEDVVDPFAGGVGLYTNDKLSTPAEIGVGVSYKMNEHTFAVDYKRIKWSDAMGYKDFEWDDQDVYSIGYEYATTGWALRAGYNYSKSPIKEQTYAGANSASLGAGVVNTFNLLGFPGIVESHYTFGGTYNISDKTSVDAAFVYAAEETNTYENFSANFGQPSEDISTKHSQTSLSLALNYKF